MFLFIHVFTLLHKFFFNFLENRVWEYASNGSSIELLLICSGSLIADFCRSKQKRNSNLKKPSIDVYVFVRGQKNKRLITSRYYHVTLAVSRC